jgi:hypothetical protein
MSTRNIEAVRIFRPIALGQVRDDIEACATAIVDLIFGVNLLPPFDKAKLWHA